MHHSEDADWCGFRVRGVRQQRSWRLGRFREIARDCAGQKTASSKAGLTPFCLLLR